MLCFIEGNVLFKFGGTNCGRINFWISLLVVLFFFCFLSCVMHVLVVLYFVWCYAGFSCFVFCLVLCMFVLVFSLVSLFYGLVLFACV